MILGLRCSSNDYAFAVLDGKRTAPKLVARGFVSFPKSFSRLQSVVWFSQELDTLLGKRGCSEIVMKAFEGRARDSSFVERIEHETAAYFAASKKGKRAPRRSVP